MALLPKVKLKTVVSFPAAVYGGAGIAVRKENGKFYFDLNFAAFPVVTIPSGDLPNTNVLTYNVASKAYLLAPYGAGGIADAPNDGTLYGRKSLAWSAVPPGIADAPSDGTIYGRQNAAWVASGGGSIALTKNCGFLSYPGPNIRLSPLYGNLLTVDGVNAIIPDAGVTLAATGLTVGTLYYIYATQSAGTVNALEASTTIPVVSTTAGTKGLKVKNGDVTRRLVGMVRPIAGPAFSDLAAQRFVRSWLNRDRLMLSGPVFSGSTTSTSYVEITTTARLEFLIWSDETLDLNQNGQVYNTTTNSTYSKIYIDAAGAGGISLGAGGSPGTATGDVPMGLRMTVAVLSEGYHFATVYGITSGASTGNWYSGAGGCNLTGMIR